MDWNYKALLVITCVLLFFSAFNAKAYTTSSHWAEENNGNDSIGSNNLTTSGSNYVNGIDGYGFDTQSTGYQYTTTFDSFQDSDDPFTLSIWTYLNSQPSSVYALFSVFHKSNTSFADVGLDINYYYNTGNPYLEVRWWDNITAVNQYSIDLYDSEWHNITISSDGTLFKLYIDGQWEAQDVIVGDWNVSGTDKFTLGQYDDTNTAKDVWDGIIDEVSFYDETLTDDNIEDLYFEHITPPDINTPIISLVNPTIHEAVSINLTEIPMYVDFDGLCLTSGSDRVYIHDEQSSFIPVEADFTSSSIDCVGQLWEKEDVFIGAEYNEFQIWARDFLDTPTSTPVYGIDYFNLTINGIDLMSFDPSQYLPINIFTEDNPCDNLPAWFQTTSSIPWFQFVSSTEHALCQFYGADFNENTNILIHNKDVLLKEKAPFGYINELYELWIDRATSTDSAITLDLANNAIITSTSPLKNLYWDVLSIDDLQYENQTGEMQDVIDFGEDVLLPWIIGGFIVWAIGRLFYSVSN